jgi:CTP synthase
MEKVSMFCHVQPKQVLGVHNVQSTYHVPLLLREQGLLEFFRKRLELPVVTPEHKQKGENLLARWRSLTGG